MWTVGINGGNMSGLLDFYSIDIGPLTLTSKFDGEYLRFYARTVTVPSLMQDNIKRRYSGVEYNLPGRETSPKQFRVSFWDNSDLEVYKFIQNWFHMTNDPAYNRRMTPEDYRRQMYIELEPRVGLVPQSNFGLTKQRFIMDACWPVEVSDTTLSYESSEVFTFDVTFAFRKRFEGSDDVSITDFVNTALKAITSRVTGGLIDVF